MNLPTVITAALLTAVVIAIVAFSIKKKKEGKCSCGGNCGNCNHCH